MKRYAESSRNATPRRAEKKEERKVSLGRIPHVLLLIDTAGAFGRSVIRGVGRYALEHGPWSIRFVYRSLDSLPPTWLKQWRGDGIISRTITSQQATILRETKLPVVELHGVKNSNQNRIRIDVNMEAVMAVDHFIDCGLRNFGFFCYGNTWWMDYHRDAFRQVVRDRGFDSHDYFPPASNRSIPVWRENQQPGLIQWLRGLPRPIGIFSPGDIHSAFLLDVCREINIPVPEEMAILGAGNDTVICETVRPSLSSVDINARRMGFEAAKLLDQMMNGRTTKEDMYIPPSHVVVRQSTDLMAIEDADVAQAMRLIREYACKGIDVGRVAEEVGLSRRAMERRFLKHVGRTPKGEIMRVRIERAKTLMAQTDQTSESIAKKSGFSTLEYFTQVFRRHVGMKPQAYRKMRRISRDLGSPSED
jgi:LacI family transcriptional regulator